MNECKLRIRIVGAACLAALSIAASAHPALSQDSCPDPAAFAAQATGALAHVRFLADDALEGRAAASAGERCAAAYIVARLSDLGLGPAGDDGSWLQAFPVRTGTSVETARLRVEGTDVGAPGPEWAPFGFSASAAATGRLRAVAMPDPHAPARGSGDLTHGVAGGHGDAGGHGEPQGGAGSPGWIAVIDGAGLGDAPIDAHFLAAAMAAQGAAGVLFLLPEGSPLPNPSAEIRPAVGIPAVAVAGALGDRVRAAAARGAEAALDIAVEPVMSEARNVVAVLRGSDPARADEPVILGAHYDHLGRGGQGSLAPDSRDIHNGADDNASGTAALLEAARLLASGPRPARPVVFIAFSGEERGLLGSGHFVAHPTVPLDGAVAMVNMDMVGRLRAGALTAHGLGTAEEWDAILDAANAALAEPLEISRVPDGYGPSDHSSFYGAGIPVLFFFTNTHADYHRPSDDWQAVNGEGIELVARLTAEVVARLAGAGHDPVASVTLVRGAGRPREADPDAPSSGGYGPYLGSIPDMTPIEGGVRLTGVREDSPAERAGLREGDVIVRFGNREVVDLYAFTYALREHEPGDVVEIVVLRGGDRVSVEATLGRRR